MVDILSEYPESAIKNFKKEFLQIMWVARELDRYYGESKKDAEKQIAKFQKILADFNKKFKHVDLKLKQETTELKTRILINEPTIQDLFTNSASKIPGIKSAGESASKKADISQGRGFSEIIESAKKQLYLSYSDQASGTSSFTLKQDKEKVEIVYNPFEIQNETSASFKLSAYYALKEFDEKIKLYEETCKFGFLNPMNEFEKRDFYDSTNPRLLE